MRCLKPKILLDATLTFPTTTGAAIQGVYPIEAQVKVDKIGLPALLELRSKQSRPMFENVGKSLDSFAKMRPPKTPFGKAISYALNKWKAMERYLRVSEAEIDNNSIEQPLRGVVMGRRNWLHVGGEVGGEWAAILFSLTISCRRLKVEPYAYLCDNSCRGYRVIHSGRCGN